MARLSVRKKALPAQRMGAYEGRTGELGAYTVAFESMPAGFPPGGADAFKGLPDGACQSPHWGYLVRGRFRATLVDGSEEVVEAGSAYYLPPGHRFESLEPCETVEFSPTVELLKTFAILAANGRKSREEEPR